MGGLEKIESLLNIDKLDERLKEMEENEDVKLAQILEDLKWLCNN